MSERDELVARLRGCNPPDRTIDEQRPLAQMIHDAADLLERDGARIAELEAELDEARAALDDVSAALGTNEFMDPPDGGSPSLAEQVRRMRAALAEAQRDAERYRLMRRNPTVDGESLVVVEVLDFNEDGPTDVYYAYAGDPLDAAIDAVIAKEQSHASE